MHDENKRIFMLNGKPEDVAEEITFGIISINKSDDKKEKELNGFERRPIELYINCEGGSVISGFSIIDVILNSKTPVHTICNGCAMSMGLHILVSGHKRYAMPHSVMMFHQISTGGNYIQCKTLADFSEYLVNMNKRLSDFIIERTKMTKTMIDENYNTKEDKYIFPEEALKLGIVDEII